MILTPGQSNTEDHHQGALLVPHRLERVGICSMSALAPLQALRLCETAFGAVFA